MPDYRDDVIVDELLGDFGAGARIGRVILAVELQTNGAPVNRQALRADLFQCEARAVLVVLAEMSLQARKGAA